MRFRSWIILLLFLGMSFSIPSDVSAQWVERTHARFDTNFLARTRSDEITLLTDSVAGNNITTDALGFGMEPNIRLAMGFHLLELTSLELSYWGTGFWSDKVLLSNQLDTNGNGQYNAALDSEVLALTTSFQNISDVTITYDSRAHNAEMNNIYPVSDETEWLVGIRYFNMFETFNMHTTTTIEGAAFASGRLRYHTNNNLLGLQVGGTHRHIYSDRLDFDFVGKTGFGINMAERCGHIEDLTAGALFNTADFHASSTHLSWYSEFGVTMVYRLGEYIYFRMGYEMFLVTGLAMAPDQFDNGNNGNLVGFFERNKAALYQGAFIGFEYRPPF